MYEQHFQFTKPPFNSIPSAENYFPSQSSEQCLQRAMHAIERATGPVIILGAVGTGKSMVLTALAEYYRENFATASISCSVSDGRMELLQSILFELGMNYRDMTQGEMRLKLIDFLAPVPQSAGGLLLLADDAHRLDVEMLEELRMISNVVRDGQPRVRLVMSGTYRLDETLSQPQLESFNQQISARCTLGPFTGDETAQYILAQIEAAGRDGCEIFRPSAINTIFDVTEGNPRLINQLCDLCLLNATSEGQQYIDAISVEKTWADLQQLPYEPPKSELSSADSSPVVEFGELQPESDVEAVDTSTVDMPLAASAEQPAADQVDAVSDITEHPHSSTLTWSFDGGFGKTDVSATPKPVTEEYRVMPAAEQDKWGTEGTTPGTGDPHDLNAADSMGAAAHGGSGSGDDSDPPHEFHNDRESNDESLAGTGHLHADEAPEPDVFEVTGFDGTSIDSTLDHLAEITQNEVEHTAKDPFAEPFDNEQPLAADTESPDPTSDETAERNQLASEMTRDDVSILADSSLEGRRLSDQYADGVRFNLSLDTVDDNGGVPSDGHRAEIESIDIRAFDLPADELQNDADEQHESPAGETDADVERPQSLDQFSWEVAAFAGSDTASPTPDPQFADSADETMEHSTSDESSVETNAFDETGDTEDETAQHKAFSFNTDWAPQSVSDSANDDEDPIDHETGAPVDDVESAWFSAGDSVEPSDMAGNDEIAEISEASLIKTNDESGAEVDDDWVDSSHRHFDSADQLADQIAVAEEFVGQPEIESDPQVTMEQLSHGADYPLDQPETNSTAESKSGETETVDHSDEPESVDLRDDRDIILVSRKQITTSRSRKEFMRPVDDSDLDHTVSTGRAIRMDYEHLFARLRSPDTGEKELA